MLVGLIGSVQRVIHDGLVYIDVFISDFQVEVAVGVRTNPRFIMNAGSLAVEIGQGNKVPGFAFQTSRKIDLAIY